MAFLNDPGAGAGQQKQLLVVMALTVGIFLIYSTFFVPDRPAPAPPNEVAAASEEGAADNDAGANTEANAVDQAGTATADATPSAPALAPHRIRTENLDLHFTNVGGRALAASIIAPDQYIPREDELEIFPQLPECPDDEDDCHAATDGLVGADLPLSLRLGGYGTLGEDAIYEFDEDSSDCGESDCARIAYTWTSPDGQTEVTRTYEPNPVGGFSILGGISIRNLGTSTRAFDGLEIVNYSGWTSKSGGMFNQAATVVEGICQYDGKTKTKPGPKLDEVRAFSGEVDYAGVNERYFLNAVGFDDAEGRPMAADYCEFAQDPQDPENRIYSFIGLNRFEVAPGETHEFTYTWFIGPKRFDYLNKYEHDFGKSVKFGFFSFLAAPIRFLLIFFHGLVGNWGVAIILLTLTIKLLLLPITTKAYKSMEAMKKIQPKLEKIKEKYKNDQQKLAEAQMALFREEGVSPLGGCLPLLLQMPVYFALYRTIWGSAELYNAPFVGWIQDLSQRDPLFILPVLMSVMMFAQQRLMPQNNANPQMKMMQWMMPLMFIPVMLFLPSGLVLYIFCNMILTVIQQLVVKRRLADNEE